MKLPVLLLIFLFCFCADITFAQKQGNIWYFGNRAGLDFNSGAPVALTDGDLSTTEGCATISDKNGRLLFYTDGTFVWNRQHKKMPNGSNLYGHRSSSNSAVIVPFPSNTNKYYIFTVDYESGSNGFNYSVADMRKDNGLGDITIKNVKLLDYTAEKLTAVKHDNGKDIWVITHFVNSSKFAAYLVTDKGVSAPVISDIGFYIPKEGPGTMGCLKASPNGKYIVSALLGATCQLFKFDNASGKIYDCVTLKKHSFGAYGIEFSPNSKLLYATGLCDYSAISGIKYDYWGEMYQYNISLEDTSEITKQAVMITDSVPYAEHFLGALQLEPDRKIYVAQSTSPVWNKYLHVITKPNSVGIECNYQKNAVYLSGKSTGIGLPTFIQSYFSPLSYMGRCFGEPTKFNYSSPGIYDSLLWDFGDPNSGTDNYSRLQNPTHTFTDTGTFKIQLVVWSNHNADTFKDKVEILEIPKPHLGADRILCKGDSLQLAGGVAKTFFWSTGDTTQKIIVKESGKYWLRLSNAECTATDTINIVFLEDNLFWLGRDTTVCEGQSIELKSRLPVANYLWSTGSTKNIITVNKTGKYWLKARVGGCEKTDTIKVNVLPMPKVAFGVDLTVCQGEQVLLNAYTDSAKYVWSTGDTSAQISVRTSGQYQVYAYNGSCFAADNINITFVNEEDFLLGNDTLICEQSKLLLSNKISGGTYLWNTGSTKPAISADTSGKYWLRTKIGNCEKTDTINVTVLPTPVINLGKDLLLCESHKIELDGKNTGSEYIWSTGESTRKITVETAGTYWVFVKAGTCYTSDTININYIQEKDFMLGKDTTICQGEEIQLHSRLPNANYLWNTGSTKSSITINTTGKYWLRTKVGECEKTDTVLVKVLPIPVVDLGADKNICEGDEIILDAKNEGAGFTWNTGETSQTISARSTGKYWVNIRSGRCMASDTIILNYCPPVVYAPNAFTPNTDFVNDNFTITASDIAEATLKIYNRWGECIFETNDLRQGWDGKRYGQYCPQDLYLWILQYRGKIAPGADFTQRTGKVYLLR